MGNSLRNFQSFLLKLPSLFIGLFLFAAGIVMTLNSNLGMAPWGVFQVGLAQYTPLTFGEISQVVGLGILILGWALGFPPGFATLMNMYFVGLFIDYIIEWGVIPQPTGLPMQILVLLGGILVLGLASFLYLNPLLGAGPRDGLMMGLVQKLDRPVSHIRGAIEITVLVIGYFLGGPVGIGTLISAFTVGYSIQLAFRLGGYDRNSRHMDLYTLFRYLIGEDVGSVKD